MGMLSLKIINDYLLSQSLQQEVQRTQLLKYVGTPHERNPSTRIKPDTEWLKHKRKRGLHEFHDV